MDHDDLPVGRILSRREALQLLSGAGGAFLLGGAAHTSMAGASASAYIPARTDGAPLPDCIVRPEMTEGPYFTDERLERSDIRLEPSTGEVTPGLPLTLAFNVSQIRDGACAPLPGALVDIWQCDALGRYSAFNDNAFGFDTRDESFLRGYQRTDKYGAASFATIYPGWYPGRAVHIHFKIRTEEAEGQAYEFTSQLFFDESLNDTVHALEPYAEHGRRNRLNTNDRIFSKELLLEVASQDDAYVAAFGIGLDMTDAAAGRADGFGRGRRGRRR